MRGDTIHFYCPECQSEDLERCFAVSAELWGWSYHCRNCEWRGQRAPFWRDRTAVADDHPLQEREPFTNWPNGAGTYD